MGAKTYEGKDIEVSFDLKLCIHARNCFLKLPQVFGPNQRPWVQPDAAASEEVAAVVRSCPSGALKYARKDGGLAEAPPQLNRLRVMENGPIAVEGEISIDGAAPVTRAVLCRCGASKNKPYCDYSHVEAGFEATGEPKPTVKDAGDDGAVRGGCLEAKRITDGPLGVKGAVEVITGTGRRISRGETVFLCRCGQSKNKPFCDGSHKEAGFSDA